MHRLGSIQIMRGVAAGMVLIGHVIAEAEHYTGITLLPGLVPWTRGVDLFFVISGFIIAVSGRRYFGIPNRGRDFLVRRIVRVVPLYYLFTTLMLLVLILMPGGLKETVFDRGQILTSYAFVPYARGDGRIAPILSLGWTLNYEIFFYLLFAICLTLRPPNGIFAVIGLIAALALTGAVVQPQVAAAAFWTNSILVEFGLGVLLAEGWLKWRDRVGPDFVTGALILLAGFMLLIALDAGAPGLPRFVSAGIPAVVMLAGPLFWWGGTVDARLPRWGITLGDSSYALYLSHRFVLRGATLTVLPALPETVAWVWAYVVMVCILATWTGVLVFRHIERPMLTFLNRHLAPVRPASGPD